MAAIVIGHRERDGFVAGRVPRNQRIFIRAGDGGEIIASHGHARTETNAIGEGPCMGNKFAVIVLEHVRHHQGRVGHRGHRFCKDLDRDTVVDVNQDGLDTGVDSVRNGEGEVERGVFPFHVLPFMLLCVHTDTTA